jgi:hypothetical protein
LPEGVSVRTGIRAVYSAEENILATPRSQHEATVFHEIVHFLMSQEGLLFGPRLHRATFYDRLVDETIAELTVSDVYEYDTINNDLLGFYEKLQYGEPEALEMLAKKVVSGLPSDAIPTIKSVLETMDFPQLHIAKMEREIEEKYKRTRDFAAITEDVNALYEFIVSLSGPFALMNIAEAVRIVAVGNAINLRTSGVQPKELVSWLKDGVAHGWDSYGLYFYDIVGVELFSR